jgi:glycosyltransferase involved in cell wall biosynthesis
MPMEAIAKETPATDKDFPEVSIITPSLGRSLSDVHRQSQKPLNEHNIPGEIIVADNGSTEGSRAIATSSVFA